MQRQLLVAAILPAAVLISGARASAAAPVACKLVIDASNDTTQHDVVPTDEPELDILSADLATNAQWLTVVVGEWDGADQAASERSYVAGSRSCLRPGS